MSDIFKIGDCAAALAQAAARYHKIALVVGPPGSGKTALLRALAEQQNMPLLNLGLALGAKLLPLTARERKLDASDIITDLFDSQESPALAVDNTEIVFDRALMLNPLGLLQAVSRTRLLVWSWNGSLEDNHVIYAYPGHPEYQRLPARDMTLIVLT